MNQWDMMRGDPNLKLVFDRYMCARRDELRSAWHQIYSAAIELDVPGFQQPHQPPLLVDVGGNTGYDVASFRTKNPHIKGRCVLQDLPETLATSPASPESGERIAYDFFTAQPIKGTSRKKLFGIGGLMLIRRSSVFLQVGLPRLRRRGLPAIARQYRLGHEPRIVAFNRRMGPPGRGCSASWCFGGYLNVHAPVRHGTERKSVENSSGVGRIENHQDLANRWRL